MPRARRPRDRSSDARSDSSSSTSPERDAEGLDDDAESFTIHQNESVSSLAPSEVEDNLSDSAQRELEARYRLSPISRLPAELMLAIFSKLAASSDLRACMLVSKEWARNSVGLLWHRPLTSKWDSIQRVGITIRNRNSLFDYSSLIKRLNLSAMGNDISDGVLHQFRDCKRVERLTLTNCSKVTDMSLATMISNNRSLLALDVTGLESITDTTMKVVSENCLRLQGLNVTNCKKITDGSLEALAQRCRHLKRVSADHPNDSRLINVVSCSSSLMAAPSSQIDPSPHSPVIASTSSKSTCTAAHCLRTLL